MTHKSVLRLDSCVTRLRENVPQMHVDLWVEDISEARGTVKSLGAKLLQSAAEDHAADAFEVYADPAGHPFCLCWVRQEQPAVTPHVWQRHPPPPGR